jgi:hypothetical protein
VTTDIIICGIALVALAGMYRWSRLAIRRAEERIGREYATREVLAWAVTDMAQARPLLRATDRIAMAWQPHEDPDRAWLCKLEHASGDVDAHGRTPRLALDGALEWLRARDAEERPARRHVLAAAVRQRIEADRDAVTHVDLDEEGL